MRNILLEKGLIFGILVLFVGTNLVPCISGGWDGKTSELVNGVPPCTRNAITPSIAVDLSGTVHAAWCESDAGTRYFIYYSSRNPSTGKWSPKEQVSTESDIDSDANETVSLAIEETGAGVKVHVAWLDWSDDYWYLNHHYTYYGTKVFYKCRDPSGVWCPTEVVSSESDKSAGRLSLATYNNTVNIAWSDLTNYPLQGDNDDKYDIVYKWKESGDSWPLVTEVVSTESTATAYCPSLALGDPFQVYVVWHDLTNYPSQGDNDDKYDIVYKSKPIWAPWPTGATATEVVSTESSQNATFPSLAWDQNDDTLHVAWMDKTQFINPRTQYSAGKYDKICYKCRVSSGWPTVTELVSTESYRPAMYPSLDTDTFSRVHIAWTDYTTTIPNAGVNWLVPCGPVTNIFYKSKPRDTDWFMFSDVVSTDSKKSPYGVGAACLVIASNDSIHIAWFDNSTIRWPYHDIFYKLGAGTPYSIPLSPPTTCKILLRGFGLLGSTTGIYDLNLKDYCVVMFPLFDVFHRVQIGSSASSYLVHLPANFCYTHGEFLTPLPTGFFSGQILGNTNFDSMQLYTSTLGFIIHTVTLQSPFSITGRSYP